MHKCKWKVSLHPSSPPSTGEPLRVCWPAASLSGTGTVVQQTARPSSGQWTQLQKSSVLLSPPSWIFSILDAPAKSIISWRTPPILHTVSYSSYHQENGTGASEPASPDCSTAFSPRLWEPWTQLTTPLSETPYKPPFLLKHGLDPPPPTTTIPTLPHEKITVKLFCAIQSVRHTGEWAVQTTRSITLSSICTRHFHTLLCVHKSHKRLCNICMLTLFGCFKVLPVKRLIHALIWRALFLSLYTRSARATKPV